MHASLASHGHQLEGQNAILVQSHHAQEEDDMSAIKTAEKKTWDFVHNRADAAQWTPGLREILE